MKIYSLPSSVKIKDPRDLTVLDGLEHGNRFVYTPSRHEYFVAQLLMYSEYDVAETKVVTGALVGADKTFERAVTCFNTEGVGADGKKFSRSTYLNADEIKPLFIGVDFSRAKMGEYHTDVRVGGETVELIFILTDKLVFNEGMDDEDSLSRLKWLNSTEYMDKRMVSGYDAVSGGKNHVSFTGKRALFSGDGLMADVESNYTESNALTSDVTAHLLFRQTEFIADGQKFKYNRLRITDKSNSAVITSDGRSSKFRISVTAEARYTGAIAYAVKLTAEEDVIVNNIKLNVYFACADYMSGLGYEAGKTRAVDYKWNAYCGDSVFIGNVNCGARFRFKNASDSVTMPVYGNESDSGYAVPESTWANYGRGGIVVTPVEEGAVLTAYTGRHIFMAGDSKEFLFDILLTPFHPVNLGALGNRIGRLEGNIDAYFLTPKHVDSVLADYGSVANKTVNYPFGSVKALRKLALGAHKRDLSCGLTYSINRLEGDSNGFYALRAFDGEILSPMGDGHYVMPFSRLDNEYPESVKYLISCADIDFVSMPNPCLTASTAERINKCLARKRGGGGFTELVISDRISAEHGKIESLNLYADVLPFVSRMAVAGYGSDISDERALIGMSGIAYGMTTDSEADFGFCRSLLYGMLPRSGRDKEEKEVLADISEILRKFGIADAEIKGYWDKSNPVSADNAHIRCTSYINGGDMLAVIYNTSDKKLTFEIGVENKLGFTTVGKRVTRPAIRNMQKGRKFNVGKPVKLAPHGGVIVLVTAPKKNKSK